jgi:predicted RecA/RadA family phage recombinase
MKSKIYDKGDKVPYTNSTGSDIPVDTPIHIGSGRIGVTCDAIPDGETGTLDVQGVFELPKSTAVFAMGAAPAIDDGEIVATGSAVTTITNGWVFEAANSAATTVLMKLNG